jgi:hypothetical protein
MLTIGIPFKYSIGIEHPEAVKYAGLIYDILLFSKKTLDSFKVSPPNTGNLTMRLRLKSGKELIIVQGNNIS